MTNTDLLRNRSVMSVHMLNMCLLETLSGMVCFIQLRLLPSMGNQMSSPQYNGGETLHPAGSGVEREWREVGRSERGEGKGGRIEKGVRVVLHTVEPPNRGHFGTAAFVLSSEVVLFSEVV